MWDYIHRKANPMRMFEVLKVAEEMSKNMPISFSRDELQAIQSRANYLATVGGTNPSWVRVYERLADVASELDAYIARCEIRDGE